MAHINCAGAVAGGTQQRVCRIAGALVKRPCMCSGSQSSEALPNVSPLRRYSTSRSSAPQLQQQATQCCCAQHSQQPLRPSRSQPSHPPALLTGAGALRVLLVVGLVLRLDALAAGQAAARVAGAAVVPREAVEGAAVPRHHQAQLQRWEVYAHEVSVSTEQGPWQQEAAAQPQQLASASSHAILCSVPPPPPAAQCRCRRCDQPSWISRTAPPTGSGRGTQSR